MTRGVTLLFVVLGVCSVVADRVLPLFPYEQNYLTNDTFEELVEHAGLEDQAHVFAFDNGDAVNPDWLKPGACRAFPGDANWPSQGTWNAFNTLLGGALIQTVPAAASCYRNLGVYDAEKCNAVRENFTNQYFHENDPTSIFWPLFQGRTCMPTDDPESGNCTHGGFPVYAVNVSNVGQVQLAVNFARNANLRLVIKNTGHCYLGKSSGAGALSVWTHNLKDITYYKYLKTPEYSGTVMKVGAGVTVREVYETADKNGVSALGGICESVGYAGGYIAGGGHTPLAGLYGMAADHVLALEVVTADGQFITVSPMENQDLYWALRGGGGSTFGIVTSIIIRVHPKLPVVTSTFSFSTSPTVSPATFWLAIRAFLSLFIPFTDAATYSWWSITNITAGNTSILTFNMNPFFAPNHTLSTFTTLTAPFFSYLTDTLHIPLPNLNTTAHEAYYPAYASTWGSNTLLNGAGRVSIPGNWLIPRANWLDEAKFNATFAVMRTHVEAGRPLRGYHQAPRNRAGANNAVNPAFREVICFVVVSSTTALSAESSVEEVARASREMREDVLAPFREVAPVSEGGGAYLNEANVDERDWQGEFYGAGNYERLLGIKGKWDPKGVFYATTGVGSEAWEVRDGERGVQTQDGRLCRV